MDAAAVRKFDGGSTSVWQQVGRLRERNRVRH